MTILKNNSTKNIIMSILVFLITILPSAQSATHFNLSMISEGYLNKLLLISIVFLIIMEDIQIGITVMVLLSSLLFIDPANISEGFISYFEN